MAGRRSYHTRQRDLLLGCLAAHQDRYLTVREICAMVEGVGATTLYRNLEAMVGRGEVLKYVGADGQGRYCLAPEHPAGQLVCLECGHVQWLSCGTLSSFMDHVRADHGFDPVIDKTIVYGHCGCVTLER